MMRLTTQLRTTISEARLLCTSPEWGDVLKARLPLRPCHPRALLTLLEGVSLWNGSPLSVVIAAERGSPSWLERVFSATSCGPARASWCGTKSAATSAPSASEGSVIFESCGFRFEAVDDHEGTSC